MFTRRISTVFVVVLLVVLSGCVGGQTVAPSEPRTESASEAAAASQSIAASTANGTLEVHYINVGQSTSTLVVTPENETMLIDSGDWRDDGRYVLAYLQSQNVTRIDHLVTSHADADHIGGHATVIEYYETQADGVGAVYDPGIASSSRTYEAYLDAVEQYDVPLYRVVSNDTLPVAGANVSVLGPPSEPLAGGERNENSIVLMVTHGEQRFLFTADAESAGEGYLVETYGEQLNATVLQAGHHGSSSSTGDALLNASSPQVAVVSSAYESQYGHPHEETLARLGERSISTYWTAVHGHTVLTSDGRNLTVATQRNATTSATELRTAPPLEPGTSDPVVERVTLTGGVSATPMPVATDGGVSTPTADEPSSDGSSSSGETEETTGASDSTAETETTTDTDGETTAELSLVTVRADAPGNDHQNTNGEYLVFENTGDEPLDVTGWTVEDDAGHTYTFPAGFTLAPNAQVTLYTGEGSNTDSELYWGSGSAVWNNGGDTIRVSDDAGTVVLEERY
ncbi:lamin tail domain-containing protein [Haloprofundus salinisoli]|uniref:lamin tail domain-containing protein n=1 Tax=Haloprofundus salinisoli TaxID=2876193 RepID=UPI001CCFC79D|nr:lamin tail domain-containing protein [Haloprofundus salinisoli]